MKKIARLFISTFILYCETSTCFQIPIIATTTRQKQSCTFRLFSSTQKNKQIKKRQRRSIDLPKSKNFDEENSLKADKDTKIRNGISFNIRPNIKKNPYSSGNI